MKTLSINSRKVGPQFPTYIIAEVGSNFDGDLDRAKTLAKKCKTAGADAYKIQNFLAPKIVSAEGFENLQVSFQAKWKEPVVEVYKNAEFPRAWVAELAAYCREIGIEFLSSPYDKDAVDLLESIGVAAHKIGSGEIDNLEFLSYVARTGKPIIIGVGAADMPDIEAAIRAVRDTGNQQIIILQCVTNYPAPIADSNLRAMAAFQDQFDVLVGYSDHTIGPKQGGDDPLSGKTVPLAAVALGACVIEKHVTDDPDRTGPDHPFAMTIHGDFAEMIAGIRAVESALGDGAKRVMESERETIVIQRRGIYAARPIAKGEMIAREAIEFLRPAVGFRPREANLVIGKRALRNIPEGAPLRSDDIG